MTILREAPPIDLLHPEHTLEKAHVFVGPLPVLPRGPAVQRAGAQLQRVLFIKDGRSLSRLPLKEVLYVKADLNYVEVHTIHRRYVVRISLGEFVDQLPGHMFQRVSRSTAVNLLHLDAIDGYDLNVGPHRVKLGRAHRNELLARLRIICGR